MHAFEYEAVTHEGSVFCTHCVPSEIEDADTVPIFASEEVDSYPHCDICGALHEYMGLTQDGVAFHYGEVDTVDWN